MKLQVAFFDDGGTRVEQFKAGVAEANARIAEFVRLHGTDPDAAGAAATSGRVEFSPVDDDDDPAPSPGTWTLSVEHDYGPESGRPSRGVTVSARDSAGERVADVYVEAYDGVRLVVSSAIVTRDSDEPNLVVDLLTGQQLPS